MELVEEQTQCRAKLSKNYPLLLVSQFLGAFGDNFFLWLILGPLAIAHEKGQISDRELGEANAIYTCLLYAPYIIFAPIVGFLNDRFSKSRCLIFANLIKITGTAVAMLSMFSHQIWLGIGYFLIGVGACTFSPGKYGMLPEILPRERLVKANGTVEMLTIVAVLTGFLSGAWVADNFSILTGFFIVLTLYLLSLLTALMMARTPFNNTVRFKTNVNEFYTNARSLLKSPRTSRILLGAAMFWMAGAIMKMNFQPWGLDILRLKTNSSISLLSLWVAIGVMLGSLLAGQLHRVGDLRYTRLYGWLMGCLLILLSALDYNTPMPLIVGILVTSGVAGGLFLIPLNAALQSETDPEKLGKSIATLNLFDNIAMVIGGVFVYTIVHLGADASNVFLLEGIAVSLIVALLNKLKVKDKAIVTVAVEKM